MSNFTNDSTTTLPSDQSVNTLVITAIAVVAAHALALTLFRRRRTFQEKAVVTTTSTRGSPPARSNKNCHTLVPRTSPANAATNAAEVTITLPTWAVDYENSLQNREFTTEEEMMAVAVELSARNIKEETGG